MAKKITTLNADLLDEADYSSLSATAAGGASTLSVYSISSFAVNKILLIGEFGQEGSEIVKTHASTSPSGTTVTLVTTLTKSHPKDTKVYITPYDKLEVSWSSTATGSKTVLSTVDVDEENTQTTYVDTTQTTGYYFTRFINSITSDYTEYSDPIPFGGFDSNTVAYVINLAMKETKKKFTETLTYQTLIDEVNSCLRYVRGKLKRWSNVQEFDYTVDQIDRGEYIFTIPSTYYDPNSNRSCLDVRVGDRSLDYVDKKEFNRFLEDVHVATVATAASSGSTTLDLSTAADFDDSGTIHIYSGTTQYEITYTAKSGNTLTGIPSSGTGAITATLAAGRSVWQGEIEGFPAWFTIADGSLYIWPLINSTDSGMNIKMDFYTDIVEVNSDADEITLARHDLMKHWLKWQIRNITERNGQPDFKDGDWLMFNGILVDAVRREASGQKFKMSPKINGISYVNIGAQSIDTFKRA